MSEIPVTTNKPEYHKMAIADVYTTLQSRPEGLTKAEVDERLQTFGRNEIKKVKGKSLVIKFLSNFTNIMAILLWVGGIAALIGRMPQLAIAVWMVIVINGVFSFWQEYRAEKATEALKKLLPTYSRALRDGVEQKVLAEELVPGDVILLGEGDSISADCRLLSQAELRCDQSTLTGESRPVSKSIDPVMQQGISHTELPNLIFAGTHVASGTAKAIVFSTGMNTEFGKIAHLTQEVGEELSPLQKELETVTRIVTVIAVAVGAVFFILAILFTKIALTEGFIFAIGMIVAFVPEGLLPTVTLALAMGTQRMAKRHALVKKLSAVETLGCTTVICTDKTGTLTQNEMTVKQIWMPVIENGRLSGAQLSLTGVGYAPDGDILLDGHKIMAAQNKNLHKLLLAAALCNNARLLPPNSDSLKEDHQKANRWSILGDPTEAAMLVAAREGGVDLEGEEPSTPRLRELPFESRRKRMSTIHRFSEHARSDDGAQYKNEIAYIKGAPKEVLELCTKVYDDTGEKSITPDFFNLALAANDEMARNGLRVLAVAQRRIPKNIAKYDVDNIEKDLVFLGLMAMMDPPRPEVTAAVEECHTAGIRIIMITGDYGLTAESIARRIGTVKSEHPRIVTGFELDKMSPIELENVLKDEVIFARVAPEHKLKVVTALQDLGNVVAVTGDGVNDAPALKKADIGVAMGLSGSDVAKEAASMILTDDNFASIVNAVEEGRAVYANIKKFTTYIFTSNTPEAFPFIINVMSQGKIPLALTVMEVLSIDLGTDLVPALALGSELPEPGIMQKKPRNLKEHVIDRALLLRAYGYLGIPQAAVALFSFFFYYWTNGYYGQFLNLPGSGPIYTSATALALASVVATQIGNLFTQRTEKISIFKFPFFSNRMVWVGIGSELVLILLIVYTPFMNMFIGTTPFAAKYWLFLLCLVPTLIIFDEIVKYFKRRNDRKSGGEL